MTEGGRKEERRRTNAKEPPCSKGEKRRKNLTSSQLSRRREKHCIGEGKEKNDRSTFLEEGGESNHLPFLGEKKRGEKRTSHSEREVRGGAILPFSHFCSEEGEVQAIQWGREGRTRLRFREEERKKGNSTFFPLLGGKKGEEGKKNKNTIKKERKKGVTLALHGKEKRLVPLSSSQ